MTAESDLQNEFIFEQRIWDNYCRPIYWYVALYAYQRGCRWWASSRATLAGKVRPVQQHNWWTDWRQRRPVWWTESHKRVVVRVRWSQSRDTPTTTLHTPRTSLLTSKLIKTSRPAIAVKPRCSVYKLLQEYKCEKRALTSLSSTALTSTNDHFTVLRHHVCT